MFNPVAVQVAVATVVYPSGPTDCALVKVMGFTSRLARPKARKPAPSCIIETQLENLNGEMNCQEEKHCRGCIEYEQ